jgi:hypothetical protein
MFADASSRALAASRAVFVGACEMPWADPERNAEAVRRWRAAHPGYSSRYAHSRTLSISRYRVLDEDVAQQCALYKLSRRRDDCPEAYRRRERRWIQTTDYWSGDDADGSGKARRRAGLDDEA